MEQHLFVGKVLVWPPFPKAAAQDLYLRAKESTMRQTFTYQRGFGSGLKPYLPFEAADGLNF